MSADVSHNPVSRVQWVPVEKVYANSYNPNSVAVSELHLLYVSIKHDGFTMPIVTIRDAENDRWVIVDGFHRFTILKRYRDIYEKNHGLCPIVVIDKPLNDLMASTVRHNRARGKHSIQGMGGVVMQMLSNGWRDARICAEIGLEKEELARLKHITGYAKLYKDAEYSRALETPRQIEARLKPFTIFNLSKAFNQIKDAAGLPAEYQARDMRRAGLDETGDAGATDDELRALSGHKSRNVVSGFSRVSRPRAGVHSA